MQKSEGQFMIVKIKKLILVNKIEEFYEEKLISQEKDTITLNYFANLEDKKNGGGFLNDVLLIFSVISSDAFFIREQ